MHAEVHTRFAASFAAQVGLDPGALDVPGTVVVGRDDRAGTGAAVCYRFGERVVVWCDPAVVDRLAGISGDDRWVDAPIPPGDFDRLVVAAGFAFHAAGEMRLPRDGPVKVEPPVGYRRRGFDADGSDDPVLIRCLLDRCDPADVEAAAYDDVEIGGEAAVTVVTVDGAGGADSGMVVALSSAAPWDWDPDFADIGVLVDPARRGEGLGRVVVAGTVTDLIASGRVPLYRHDRANLASRSVAVALGFAQVATLDYYHVP